MTISFDPRRHALHLQGWGTGRAALEVEVDGRTARWQLGSDLRASALSDGWTFANAQVCIEWRWQRVSGGWCIFGEVRARQALSLHRLDLLHFDASLPPLQALTSWHLYQHGYSSWAPARAVPATARPVFPLVHSFAVANHYVASPWWKRRDGLLSAQLAVLTGHGEEPPYLAGFLTQNIWLGEIFLRNQGAPGLEISLDAGGKRLQAGQCVPLEPLLLVRDPQPLARFAQESASANQLGPWEQPAPVGWCSWYHFYTQVTEDDIQRNTQALTRLPELGISVVQIDDGFQTAIGDWLSLNAKFPQWTKMIQAIHRSGFTPGLWLAPFLAGRRSKMLRSHPEWALRTARGRPVSCGINPAWRDETLSLDLSHEGVQQWLYQVFATLADQGFDYFKVDFLYGGLQPGHRADPSLSPVESYRRGMQVIRDAIGPNRFLLGCGAPLGPSMGFVDAMRISCDVQEKWSSRFWSWVGAGCGPPSAREACANNVTRAFLHRRWWLNDPDCLLVRTQNTELTEEETVFLVTVLGITGGLLLISDDLHQVPLERRHLVQAVLPPTLSRPYAPQTLTQEYPQRFVITGPSAQVTAWLNWGETIQHFPLATGPARIDFWDDRPTNAATISVPPHGVIALQERKVADHPVVVGCSLHLTALADGRVWDHFQATAEGQGFLTVQAAVLSRQQGSVWISLPPGWRPDGSWASDLEVTQQSNWICLTIRRPTPWEMRLGFRRTTVS